MLHNISIVHGDIKEDNFIETGSDVYIIDFGSSASLLFGDALQISTVTTKWKPCGAAREDMKSGDTHATNKLSDWISFSKMIFVYK